MSTVKVDNISTLDETAEVSVVQLAGQSAEIDSLQLAVGAAEDAIVALSGAVDDLEADKLNNPMTTTGDMIVGGASGSPTRLASGVGFLKSNDVGVKTWVDPGANIVLSGYTEALLNLGSGSVVNVNTHNVFRKTMTEATTFTFTSPITGSNRCVSFTLYLEGGNLYAPTFPISVVWSGGAPVLTAKDRIVFETIDGGVTWIGTYSGSYA